MLAAERYATICYYSYGRGGRTSRKRRKWRDAVGIVVAVWLISAILAVPELFRVTANPVFADSPLLTSCASHWPTQSDFLLQLFYFGFLFLLPLGVIAFCYYKIVRALIGFGSSNGENSSSLRVMTAGASCPSLMAPSMRSRSSSSANRKLDTKISHLQSDYSEPVGLFNYQLQAYNNHHHLQQQSNANSRNTSFSMAATNGTQMVEGNNQQQNLHQPLQNKPSDSPSAQLRQRWRLTKMLITIVTLFVISYLPVYIYTLSQ